MKKTVFTTEELKSIFDTPNGSYINLLLQPLKRKKILNNLAYGVWAFKDYDVLELASKLKSFSYISLETVLQQSGIIFQEYSKTITLVSNNTLTKNIDGVSFQYHKIRDTILTNPLGIISKNNILMASPERAVADMIYLYKNIYFDNLSALDVQKLEVLAEIYPKSTILQINKLIKNAQSSTT